MKFAPALAGLALLGLAAPALAQNAAPAATPDAGKLSVQTSKIGDIIKNEKAKAVIVKHLPQITDYFDQIGGMTLAELAPMSQGMIDDAKLKAIQADLDAVQ